MVANGRKLKNRWSQIRTTLLPNFTLQHYTWAKKEEHRHLFDYQCLSLCFGEPFSLSKWSWRESNPRPNKWQMCFLHAYFMIDFRAGSGHEPPRQALASKTSSAARGLPPTIPFSRAPPNHIPTGMVCGRCLVPATVAGIKPVTYCTSVRQQERSYFRQLSFCIGCQGCWCVSLHAYKSPSLLSKPVSPGKVLLQKKSPQKLWGLLFVWRSGRDSNSRPHAWQACILTKLNYRTIISVLLRRAFSLKSGCKSTNIFQTGKIFFITHDAQTY